jgi:nucleoside-diphosphate-sugar epimerase
MNVLILGGHGFIGRNIKSSLQHVVIEQHIALRPRHQMDLLDVTKQDSDKFRTLDEFR